MYNNLMTKSQHRLATVTHREDNKIKWEDASS